MSAPTSGYCPQCRGGHIRKRYAKPWECRGCGHRFLEPLPLIEPGEVQRTLNRYPADSTFWSTEEGQHTLSFAAQHGIRPALCGPGWAIRFAIRKVAAEAAPRPPVAGPAITAGGPVLVTLFKGDGSTPAHRSSDLAGNKNFQRKGE